MRSVNETGWTGRRLAFDVGSPLLDVVPQILWGNLAEGTDRLILHCRITIVQGGSQCGQCGRLPILGLSKGLDRRQSHVHVNVASHDPAKCRRRFRTTLFADRLARCGPDVGVLVLQGLSQHTHGNGTRTRSQRADDFAANDGIDFADTSRRVVPQYVVVAQDRFLPPTRPSHGSL